jgi:hypothetical protein
VVGYASNPDALLRCYFGYAQLGANDLLVWTYREELELSSAERPALRDVGMVDARPDSFDAGLPQAPVLRPRSPLDSVRTGEPVMTPEKTGVDD